MWQYLVGMAAVPILLIGWLLIQQAARRYAEQHPELGEYREEGGGCGKHCGCKGGGYCPKNSTKHL